MDRELILATLAFVLTGGALLAGGRLPHRSRRGGAPDALERSAWRRLWLPLAPAAIVLAFLLGWALQEPEASEPAGPVLIGFAAAFAAVWVRAGVRAVRSLRMRPDAPAVTHGLWRPRVVIAPALADHLDPHALAAVEAHEAAHARHRDPLRVWLAQIATDLQWPSRSARARFADWRTALELARDAEACERVDGSDLAAALIEVARLGSAAPATTVALVTTADAGEVFSDRIHRLLDGAHAPRPARRRWPAWALLGLGIAAAIVAGGLYGETIISLFPGLG